MAYARKTPYVIGMALASILVSTNYVEANWIVIALMALAFFGKGLAAVDWAVLAEKHGGLSGGVFNGIGNFAGIVTPLVIGYFVAATGSFHAALWFVAAHGGLDILAYVALAGSFERVQIGTQRQPSAAAR